MRTSELYKSQPVLCFLAPAGPDTAPLRQPAKGPFNHPAACWVLLIFWYRFRHRFVATTSVTNVLLIVGSVDQLMNVREIVPFVQAEMLLATGAPDHNREDEVIDRPLVMLIGAGDVQGQRSATLVNQEMDLGPALSTIRWIAAGSSSTQGSRDRFAVDCLPLPLDTTLPSIEADQVLQDLVPDTRLLPGLETFMEHTAGNTKPISVYRFPLTSCPEHIPDAIDNSAVVCTRSTGPAPLGSFGKILLDTAPQGAWDMEVIDIFWVL